MNAVVNHPPEIAPAKDMAGRVKTRDWERVSNDLDAQGAHESTGCLTRRNATQWPGVSGGRDVSQPGRNGRHASVVASTSISVTRARHRCRLA